MSRHGWDTPVNAQYEILRCRFGTRLYTRDKTVSVGRWVGHDAACKYVTDPGDGETILIRRVSDGAIVAFKARRTAVTFEPVAI